MSCINYDLTLLANIPAKAESQMHELEQAARGVGYLVNANKSDYMNLKNEGTISSFSGKPLIFLDHFTYLVNRIISKVSYLKIYLAKSNLPDETKREFFQAITVSIQPYGHTVWKPTKGILEKQHDNAVHCLEQILKERAPKYLLYCHLPSISQTILVRRRTHAGNSSRSKDISISNVLLYNSIRGLASVSRPTKTYDH